ncbi:MAG: hypothetical protein ABIE42_05700 [Candidatus Eisenbacteria bacterium]
MTTLIRNPEDLPPLLDRRQAGTLSRIAVGAGAKPPLTYIGIGMTGIVFCDSAGRWAFKVARDTTETVYRLFEAEAEWLRAAGKVAGVRQHVARFGRWVGKGWPCVVRECVWGRPGAWADERDLFDLHQDIEKRMIPHGWTAPEFKGDSYIYVGAKEDWLDEKAKMWRKGSKGKPILVDAGMAHRVGAVLLQYTAEVMRGERRNPESLTDLAFQIRREIGGGTIPKEYGEQVLEKMYARGARRP